VTTTDAIRPDITTVADDLIVAHAGTDVHRMTGLDPATTYDVLGVPVTTLARPSGVRRSTIATVNDLHFGEVEAGRIDDHPDGPIRRAEPGAEPYPEVMNRTAADEIARADPDAVIVKGDLSRDGTDDEWAAFERCFREPFGERLHVVRGNHDSYRHQAAYAGDRWIELPGVNVALLDTAIPGQTTGTLTATQIDWLDAHAAGSTAPVLVMGHHQQWIGHPDRRSDDYFGLHPDPSDALDDVAARRPAIVAYAAGHTHRHRVRTMHRSGIPSIEVGCTKDFPGTWAEYRVFDGGIMQVVHRMSSPEALAWSESCRGLYRDFGVDYATYALGTLNDRCLNIPLR
jgi:predicted phosphodiesterase